jgi:hypothetical protein
MVTTNFHVVSRQGMRGSIRQHQYTSAWRDAQLNIEKNLSFALKLQALPIILPVLLYGVKIFQCKRRGIEIGHLKHEARLNSI